MGSLGRDYVSTGSFGFPSVNSGAPRRRRVN